MSFHGIHMMHNALIKRKCLLHQRVSYAVDAMNDPATRLKEAREAAGNPAFQAPFRCDQPGDDIEDIRVIATVVASTQFW